jgi:hypothetical protein
MKFTPSGGVALRTKQLQGIEKSCPKVWSKPPETKLLHAKLTFVTNTYEKTHVSKICINKRLYIFWFRKA